VCYRTTVPPGNDSAKVKTEAFVDEQVELSEYEELEYRGTVYVDGDPYEGTCVEDFEL
jgi:hypothetical protein